MKILYFVDYYVDDLLYAPAITMFLADDEKEDFKVKAMEHFKAVSDKITNEHIEAKCNYRVRLALIGDIYRPGNYGKFDFAEIFNFYERNDGECLKTELLVDEEDV